MAFSNQLSSPVMPRLWMRLCVYWWRKGGVQWDGAEFYAVRDGYGCTVQERLLQEHRRGEKKPSSRFVGEWEAFRSHVTLCMCVAMFMVFSWVINRDASENIICSFISFRKRGTYGKACRKQMWRFHHHLKEICIFGVTFQIYDQHTS